MVLEGEYSEWMEVLSSVPQGYVLGAILFNVFINVVDTATLYQTFPVLHLDYNDIRSVDITIVCLSMQIQENKFMSIAAHL